MTDARECRPPEGTPNQSWHWVEQRGKPTIWLWTGKLWIKNGRDMPAWPASARPRLRYLGPVEPWRERAAFRTIADGLDEGIQVSALRAAMAEASDYEDDAHALSHAHDVLAELRDLGWTIVRENADG